LRVNLEDVVDIWHFTASNDTILQIMKKKGSGRSSHGVVGGTAVSKNFLGRTKKVREKLV